MQERRNLSLKDVNLHIKSGQTVGIIGGTGSAKSTLVQLIPRLYDVTKGNVRWEAWMYATTIWKYFVTRFPWYFKKCAVLRKHL